MSTRDGLVEERMDRRLRWRVCHFFFFWIFSFGIAMALGFIFTTTLHRISFICFFYEISPEGAKTGACAPSTATHRLHGTLVISFVE